MITQKARIIKINYDIYIIIHGLTSGKIRKAGNRLW